MTLRTISGAVFLAVLLPVLLLVASPDFVQSQELSPEVTNRPLKPCSPPPSLDSNVHGVLWPGGVVPYVFDVNVTPARKTAMLAAMKEWENVSPVRFVPRSNEPDYLHIKDDPGNWSHVGKIGGKQEMGIYNWNSKFQMAHELCHALGFVHEHQRPDRDIFVTIDPSKVNDPNYRLEPDALVTSSYDFDSVMHGDSTFVMVSNHQHPIWHSRIGQRDHLSLGDIRGIQIAYGEPDRPPSEYGFATTIANFIPTFHTQGEFACIGNSDFQLVSRNLTGGTTGVIVVSTGKASTLLAGLKIYADLTGVPFLSWFPLPVMATGSPSVPGSGVVNLPIALPNAPSLVGSQFFLQGAFYESTVQWGTTAGMWLTFQEQLSKDITCLYDRNRYQEHVTNATVGQAVWNANAVSGFSYVKTQVFTCGGQSYWIVIVKHQQTGIDFCLIPGGSFQMGDITNTGNTNETPVHYVHLEPFLLARTEVTQEQFYEATGGGRPWVGKSCVQIGATNAASYIDWYSASLFCARQGMRLPTESEWEYACRAGTTTCYYFGENYPPTNFGNFAWYIDNARNVYETYPHAVGQKLPNAFGLYDMYGNVAEYCLDEYKSYYNHVPTNGTAWDTGLSDRRIVRGGCWDSGAVNCRSASRSCTNPGSFGSKTGFRLARPLR